MRRWVVVLVAVLALFAGVCGDDDDGGAADPKKSGGDPAAAKVVVAAADKTAEANSARVDLTIDVVGQAQPNAIKATGKFDFVKNIGLLRMDASAVAGEAAGNDAVIDLVLDRNVIFMRFPLLTELVPGAKEWLKLDLAQLAEQANVPLNLDQLSQADPTQALQFLRGATEEATKVADEELRGDKVTHYKVSLDLKKAAEAAKKALGDEQEALGSAISKLEGELPAEVWIDEEGRMRRLSFNLKDVPGAPAEAAGGFSMDMYDFGVVVDDLKVPAPDQVTDFAELLSQVTAQTSTTTPG